jgi:hypothetical protein
MIDIVVRLPSVVRDLGQYGTNSLEKCDVVPDADRLLVRYGERRMLQADIGVPHDRV